MDKLRPRTEPKLKGWRNLLFATAIFLSGCLPETPKQSTESPIVICSVPTAQYPNAIMMMMLKRSKDASGNIIVEVEAKHTSGSNDTKPQFDGGLKPLKGMRRTDIVMKVPVGRSTDKSGKETLIFVDLEKCIINNEDKEKLEKFIDGLLPDEIRPPDQQAFNSKPLRYGADARARILARLNPQKGIRNY